MIRILFTALLYLIAQLATAQHVNIILKTKIHVEDLECQNDYMPKKMVIETFSNPDWKLYKTINIDKCENYLKIPKVENTYRIHVEAEGYDSYITEFEVNSITKDTLKVDEIILFKKSNQLEEVIVVGNTGKKEFIKVEANKTIVQINNNDLFTNGSLQEAITKLPGIMPGPDDTIMLNGKAVSVWIDGQSTGLSGQDLVNFLNSIPANLIEKIEIISNPNASYDANASHGILNVITTSKSYKGISGTITSNYYRNQKNNISNSINLNGKIKNFNWQCAVGQNHKNQENDKDLSMQFFDFNPSQSLSQNQFTSDRNNNYFVRTSLLYNLSNQSKIGVKYNFNTGANNQRATGIVWQEDNLVSNNIGQPKSSHDLNDLTLSFVQNLDSLGRKISLLSNYSQLNRNQESAITHSNDNFSQDMAYSISDLNAKTNNKSVKMDVEIPYDKIGFTLKTGAKWNENHYFSNGFYNLNSDNSDILHHPIYNDTLLFNYKESIWALYVDISKNLKKWHFNSGIRWEHFHNKTTFQQAYSTQNSDFFPSASVLYELSSGLDFKVNYARKIERPAYNDLDPNYTNLIDQNTSIQGNPFLKPNILNNFEANLTYMKYVNLGFNYSLSDTENFIVFENLGNYQTTQTKKTFYNVGNYNFNISIPIPFGLFKEGMKFFNDSKNLDINKLNFVYISTGIGQTKLKNAETYFESHKPLKYITAFSQIILPYKIKLNINYIFSKGTYQIYYIDKPIQFLNFGLSKSFSNDQFKIAIYGNDIFNTNKINVLSQSNQLGITYKTKDNSQSFGIRLTYNFGKFSALHKQENIDNDDDKKRLEEDKEIKM